ncbi:MAG: 3-hydroxyisobutyrate dehydrogenase [Alphaproteobacteria bacterium]
MAHIAFIGLGNMGGPMAANLAAQGHEVSGYDIVPEKTARAAGRGVRAAASNADAADGAEIVFTMLPTGKEVREVLLETDKILDLVGPGTIVVDSSTTDLPTTRLIHDAAAKRGIELIDSPVSGGMAGAEAGTLTFMAGGGADAIDRAEDMFLAMGKKVVRAGGPTTGQAVKICNNMLLGISMIASCEAVALGEAAGVSHDVLYDVISTSTGTCWAFNVNCPMPDQVETAPANRNFAPGFTATLMLKDLTLAQEAAAATGATTPLGEHARTLYEKLCAERDSERDFSSMVEMIRAGDA